MNRVVNLAEPKPKKEPISIASYPRNDAGIADGFAARFAEKVRFVPGIGWIVWNSCLWQRDDGGKVNQFAIEMSREAQREAAEIKDEDQRKSATRHALNMGNRARIAAALTLAESNPALLVRPKQLDSDPLLLGCENGTIDLQTGTFHESNRDDLITLSAGTKWDEGASCPTWEKFLRDVTQDDAELIEYLRRAIGYILTGETSEQCFFFFFGVGANGKSVLVETIEALLGDYVHRASAELFEKRHDRNKAPELAELPGKRLILASETQEGSRLDERLIKDVTGGETLRGEAKYQAGFRYTPAAKIWLSGNHKPGITGTDRGIWRRVHLIPFFAHFSGKDCDPRMAEKLRAELPGILRWAVAGCLSWRKDGLPMPKKVRLAVEEYQSDEDTLGRFIADRIEDAPGESTVPKGEVYEAYRDWAEGEGFRYPMKRTKLTLRLKERGYHCEEKYWRGICLKDE